MEYFKKAVILLVLVAVFMTTSSFTYHTDTVKNIVSRISSVTHKIELSVQQAAIQTAGNIVQAIGVEKLYVLEPASLDLPAPVEITESIPCVIIGSDSVLAWMLRASPINASGMTLNPIGIISIGDMPKQKLKEELYHWWDAGRMGPLSYYTTYVLEFTVLCVNKLSSNDAYWSLPLETTAKEYANQ